MEMENNIKIKKQNERMTIYLDYQLRTKMLMYSIEKRMTMSALIAKICETYLDAVDTKTETN